MDVWVHGWMYGVDVWGRCMGGCICMNVWVDVCMNGWMYEWMYG